jgi:hypothetical protein
MSAIRVRALERMKHLSKKLNMICCLSGTFIPWQLRIVDCGCQNPRVGVIPLGVIGGRSFTWEFCRISLDTYVRCGGDDIGFGCSHIA